MSIIDLFLKLYGISLNQEDVNALKADSQFKEIQDDKILNEKIINWFRNRSGHSDVQEPKVDANSQLFNELRKGMNW